MKEFAVVYSVNGFLYVKPFQRFESAEKEYYKISEMGYSVGFMVLNKEKERYEENERYEEIFNNKRKEDTNGNHH